MDLRKKKEPGWTEGPVGQRPGTNVLFSSIIIQCPGIFLGRFVIVLPLSEIRPQTNTRKWMPLYRKK
jgi:hypothetical protein